jgi:hypothetical protein
MVCGEGSLEIIRRVHVGVYKVRAELRWMRRRRRRWHSSSGLDRSVIGDARKERSKTCGRSLCSEGHVGREFWGRLVILVIIVLALIRIIEIFRESIDLDTRMRPGKPHSQIRRTRALAVHCPPPTQTTESTQQIHIPNT